MTNETEIKRMITIKITKVDATSLLNLNPHLHLNLIPLRVLDSKSEAFLS